MHLYKNTSKETRLDSQDSPRELALTMYDSDSQMSTIVIYPLNLSFTEKEKAYALVQWKLKNLLSFSDEQNHVTSANYVLSKSLPDHVVMTTILSYAGYRQEVFLLLLSLTKHTQHYAVKNHDKLAPLLVEGQPIIERYLSGDKQCMQDYSEGRQKRV